MRLRFKPSGGLAALLLLSLCARVFAQDWSQVEAITSKTYPQWNGLYLPEMTVIGDHSFGVLWGPRNSTINFGNLYNLLYSQSDDGVNWSEPEDIYPLVPGVESTYFSYAQGSYSLASNATACRAALAVKENDLMKLYLASKSMDTRTWAEMTSAIDQSSHPLSIVSAINLACDPSGTWLLSGFSEHERLITRSLDDGQTWESPRPFNHATMGEPLNCAGDGHGNWIAVFTMTNDIPPPYSGYASAAVRSSDNGLTWSEPVYFSPLSSLMSQAFAWVTTDRKGHWVATWSDFPLQQVLAAHSEDNGATWSSPMALFSPGNPDYCDSRVVTDFHGTWILTFRSGWNGILSSRSYDNGVSWSPLETITAYPPNLFGAGLHSFAALPNGTWTTVFSVGTTSGPTSIPAFTTAKLPVTDGADMAGSISASSPAVILGSTLDFSCTATNHGPADALGNSMDVVLPAELDYVPGTETSYTYNPATKTVTAPLDDLTSGASDSISITCRAALVSSGAVVKAIASSDSFDPDQGNNLAMTTIVIARKSSDLEASLSISTNHPMIGDRVTVACGATNTGPDSAANTRVAVILPIELTYQDTGNPALSYNSASRTVTADLGGLDASASGSVAFDCIANAAVMDAGISAVASSDSIDPDGSDNTVTLHLSVSSPSADVAVSLSISDNILTVGDSVKVTCGASNAGPNTALTTVVHVTMPPELEYQQSQNPALSYDSATRTVTGAIGTVEAGASRSVAFTCTAIAVASNVAISAVASSDLLDPATGNNSASVHLTINSPPPPDLSGEWMPPATGSAAPTAGPAGLSSANRVRPGRQWTIQTSGIEISNDGHGPSRACKVSYYLSTNKTLDSADTLLLTDDLTPLSPGQNMTEAVTLTYTGRSIRNKYVIAIVDSAGTTGDTNTSNNVAVLGPLSNGRRH